MSQIRNRNFTHFVSDDEPPPKKLISDADIFIKQLAEKQRSTVTTLQEQLTNPKEFTKATELVPLASYNPGTSSLKCFQESTKHFDKVEVFKAAGLLDEDIRLFFDSLKGDDYLLQKHKNWEESLLKQRLKEIHETLQQYEDKQSVLEKTTSKELQKHDMIEGGLSVKPNSVETKLLKFALEAQKEKPKSILPHPINDIKQIETKRFAHLNENPLPSLNKIRRKARKLSKRIDNINTEQTTKNDYEKANRAGDCSIPSKNCSLAKESKWDVTENVETKIETVEKKLYTCLPQNYYTITNGEIVKLNKDEVNAKGLEVVSKLSKEEMKMLPEFENYEAGKPSKVLYIKKLSKSVKEDDLRRLFQNYDKEKAVIYKLMRGRMKGQAFITFPDKAVATQALNDLNGTLVYNKPIKIVFGHAKYS